jgi:tetratricopeptide (TPR) repeat protein
LDEAEVHHRRTLAIEERELGANHPRLASARSNLANALVDAGKLAEAAALYRKALANTEANDGPDHPDVAIYATNLGNVLEQLGELDEARAQHERALAVREAALGPDHPDLVWTLMGLAGVHLVAERPAMAVPLLERAMVIVDRGETEPRLRAGVRFELGQAVAMLGEEARARELVDAADELYRRAGPGSEKALVQVAEWRAERR